MEQQNCATDDFVISDAITDLEADCPLTELLAVEVGSRCATKTQFFLGVIQ